MHKCQFCGIEFEKYQKLGGHVIHCKKNPRFEIIKRNNDLANKSKNFHHTEEYKINLSKQKKKFFELNPDKIGYRLNHSSKESFPEKIFRENLIKNNVEGWIQEYNFGIYRFDFAFPEIKLDVEIDGGTHNLENVKKIDKERDEKSKLLGWKVLRFNAKDVTNNIDECLNQLFAFVPVKASGTAS